VLQSGSLCYAQPNAIGYAKFYTRSHDAVIRFYDKAGNVIETHEHAGEFKSGEFALALRVAPHDSGSFQSLLDAGVNAVTRLVFFSYNPSLCSTSCTALSVNSLMRSSSSFSAPRIVFKRSCEASARFFSSA
jgi:hypothetical protein